MVNTWFYRPDDSVLTEAVLYLRNTWSIAHICYIIYSDPPEDEEHTHLPVHVILHYPRSFNLYLLNLTYLIYTVNYLIEK